MSPSSVETVTPETFNAVLFYQLARFVVWAQQHSNLAASNPEFAELLRDATAALANRR